MDLIKNYISVFAKNTNYEIFRVNVLAFRPRVSLETLPWGINKTYEWHVSIPIWWERPILQCTGLIKKVENWIRAGSFFLSSTRPLASSLLLPLDAHCTSTKPPATQATVSNEQNIGLIAGYFSKSPCMIRLRAQSLPEPHPP